MVSETGQVVDLLEHVEQVDHPPAADDLALERLQSGIGQKSTACSCQPGETLSGQTPDGTPTKQKLYYWTADAI